MSAAGRRAPARGRGLGRLAGAVALVAAVVAAPAGAQETRRLAPPEPPPSFRVVVAETNPLNRIERSRLAKIFIKRITRWDDDTAIYPIDQLESSAVREAFTDEVHRKSVTAVKSFWQRMIFSGRDVPPPEHDGDASVLEAVRHRPGAVGYVSPDAELGEGVKELEVVDD